MSFRFSLAIAARPNHDSSALLARLHPRRSFRRAARAAGLAAILTSAVLPLAGQFAPAPSHGLAWAAPNPGEPAGATAGSATIAGALPSDDALAAAAVGSQAIPPVPGDTRQAPLPLLPVIDVAAVKQAAAEQPASAAQPQRMTRLPDWVQSVAQGQLFSSPFDEATTLGYLDENTYLKVLGARGKRLQVLLPAAENRPAEVAWIAPIDVQPSSPGEGWLGARGDTHVYNGSGAKATPVQDLAQGALVLRLGQDRDGRAPVRVYADDFSEVLTSGWAPVADLAPAAAPQARVPEVDDSSAKANPYRDNPAAFINAVAAAARESKRDTHVPVAVTVSQAILESDWGDSLLTRYANNLFGMKALGGLGNDGVVWMRTMEYDDAGNAYYVRDPFRAYKSLTDSVRDHDMLFVRNDRYHPAFEAGNDAQEFARRIAAGGYATDPAYADKLIAIMDRYDLYRFDA